jgi:hypothetical protein
MGQHLLVALLGHPLGEQHRAGVALGPIRAEAARDHREDERLGAQRQDARAPCVVDHVAQRERDGQPVER